ncbi:MAG: hypothetical protein PW786_03250 [Arachidicoccus sp.]|nr:hypothetical protein [Arachidicoccus sp.]
MKNTFLLLFVLSINILKAQDFLNPGKHIMSYSFVSNGANLGNLDVEVNTTNDKIAICTVTHFAGVENPDIDTSIVSRNSYAPLYRSAFHKNFNYVLHYGDEINGYYFNKETGKKSVIKDKVTGVLDNNFYQFYVTTLPLTLGYKESMNIYGFSTDGQPKISKMNIEEVRSNLYLSNLTGEHKVWQVTAIQEARGDKYVYYIDKDTRRIWYIEFERGGTIYKLIDKEVDYNPYHTTFNKEETLKLINDGKSIITGQAFVRDYVNSSKLQIVNLGSKKQLAAFGTEVTLIPYTDFFKEWVQLFDAAVKAKKQSPPLPAGATDCFKKTTINDHEGHFEFSNLMPGTYLLVTNINFVHSFVRTDVTGYTDTYINGAYQGTTPNTVQHNDASLINGEVRKIVTIKTDGEKLEVKLKRDK